MGGGNCGNCGGGVTVRGGVEECGGKRKVGKSRWCCKRGVAVREMGL